jgi:hypothetical protein
MRRSWSLYLLETQFPDSKVTLLLIDISIKVPVESKFTYVTSMASQWARMLRPRSAVAKSMSTVGAPFSASRGFPDPTPTASSPPPWLKNRDAFRVDTGGVSPSRVQLGSALSWPSGSPRSRTHDCSRISLPPLALSPVRPHPAHGIVNCAPLGHQPACG